MGASIRMLPLSLPIQGLQVDRFRSCNRRSLLLLVQQLIGKISFLRSQTSQDKPDNQPVMGLQYLKVRVPDISKRRHPQVSLIGRSIFPVFHQVTQLAPIIHHLPTDSVCYE